MMRKAPGFTMITVLTLALGIGANTAVFTIFRASLLRRLPYQEPDRLVEMVGYRTDGSVGEMPVSYPNFADVREHNEAFSSVAAYSGTTATLTGSEGAEQVIVPLASAGFFETLGVKMFMGRTFNLADEHTEGPPTVILTYGAWQRRYGSDPGVVGKSINLDGNLCTIAGVLPKSFQFGPSQSGEIWQGLRVRGWKLRRNAFWLHPVGRLKPGLTRERAQTEVSTLAKQLETQFPTDDKDLSLHLVPLETVIIGSVRPVLQMLMATVAFLLLITSANVAGLLLARSVQRQKEINVRVALGAGRIRIVRQLLTESLVLSLLGGGGGIVAAYWTVPLIIALVPRQQLMSMPMLQSLNIDIPILVFGLGLSLLTGIIFGLMPSLQAFRPDLVQRMQQGNRVGEGRGHNRLRNVLVTSEIAIAVVLLVGAGLMLKSLRNVLGTDPGFQTGNLLTLSLALPTQSYHEPGRQVQFERELVAQMNALPGVRGSAVVTIVPLSGNGNTSRFDVEGNPKASGGPEFEASSPTITADYFRVMGIPLRAGRFFNDQDNEKSKHVVIVNQALANQAFPGQNPIGKRINLTYTKEPNFWEIVGVVGDERVDRLDVAPKPIFYDKFEQDPGQFFSLTIRTLEKPDGLVDPVRRTIHELDSKVAVYDIASMESLIAQSPTMMLHGYPAYLLGTFAALALLLSILGIYGLLAYSVAQRTRELGVRMALGAQPADVLRLIMSNGLRLTIVGTCIGLPLSMVAARAIASLLFGVRPTDAATFFSVGGVLLMAALCASYIPARRAVRLDPVVALRYE
jgi:predicted permease